MQSKILNTCIICQLSAYHEDFDNCFIIYYCIFSNFNLYFRIDLIDPFLLTVCTCFVFCILFHLYEIHFWTGPFNKYSG